MAEAASRSIPSRKKPLRKDECFIVMPFGNKPFPDASGHSYDFDKVYRVVIQRAVREAGMMPIRADERLTSALIHTEMFLDLRDRSVVLVDLSLDNPNVFYELGVRHVMSSSGTVLMCRKGSVLPFDIKLSRVLFYDFDGASLDWEEVERVIKHLKLALQEAKKGLPDSPVHALLESVLREERGKPEIGERDRATERLSNGEQLGRYQQMLAQAWRADSHTVDSLFDEHCRSVFGARALGYFTLETEPLPDAARRVADQLVDLEQYRLANELYKRLHEAGKLTLDSLLAYASSMTEANPHLKGADEAIALVEQAVADTKQRFLDASETGQAALDYAKCHQRLAGLWQWRWQLSEDDADLGRAIKSFEHAIDFNARARKQGALKHPGYLAQARLKQLVLLRIRDGDIDRVDFERHRDAIIAMKAAPDDDLKGVSYLGWFQAIALADLGADDAAHEKALATFTSDAKLQLQPEYLEIGRRQYVQLRRFLEQFSRYLRHPSLIGRVSQVLQVSEGDRDEAAMD